MSDLRIRTLINGLSVVLITFFIFLAEVPLFRWVFALAVALVGVVAVWEYDQLLKKKALDPAIWLSLGAVFLYIVTLFFQTQVSPNSYLTAFVAYAPAIVLGIAFFGCFLHFAVTAKSPIKNITSTFFGILYIGIPLGFVVSIMYFFTAGGRADPHFQGTWWIIYLIAVTKGADIGGYFVGGKYGRRKLAMKLSPNKTLEGGIGGLVASILMSVALCFVGKQFGSVFEGISYPLAIAFGFIIGVLGQLGDLAESLLKRDAGIKDSNTIPGVGGILDMIDSLLFTAPVVYLFLRILYT